ncbi:MAG: hypothetical protein ABW252_19105 [Polyangiales bacterium]
MRDISKLDPGDHEVEFLREEQREATQSVAAGGGSSRPAARPLSRCVLRVSGTSEEVEDTSRITAGAAPGDRFIATVTEGVRYAAIKPKK